MYKFLREDFRANSYNFRSCLLVFSYRVANLASRYLKKSFVLNFVWAVPLLVFYRVFNELFLGLELPAATKIGRRFVIHHGYGMVINKFSIIGDDVVVRQGVTIGNSGDEPDACPIIGDNVEFGANSIAFGRITIGAECKIGAGTVVCSDMADGTVCVSARNRVL